MSNGYYEIGEPITSNECAAIKLLSINGWSAGEIKLAFGFDNNEIAIKHIEKRCRHRKSVNVKNIKYYLEENQTAINDYELTVLECSALRLLSKSNWTNSELKMIFGICGYSTVALHRNGECSHDDLSKWINNL